MYLMYMCVYGSFQLESPEERVKVRLEFQGGARVGCKIPRKENSPIF